MTSPTGSIHDGAGNYSIGVKCSWLIDAREHAPEHNSYTTTNDVINSQLIPQTTNKKTSSIRLHLEEFATECGWDHLYVYDGDSVESPLLAVFR